jgi:hypothetical protein
VKFCNKLDFLIKNFNSSNSKLARAINVDPSLVSKWRRGNRTPAPDSPHIPLLVNYFLNAGSLQHQKDALVNVLKQVHPNLENFESLHTRKALTSWLLSESNTVSNNYSQTPGVVQSIDINDILAKMSALDKFSAGIEDVTPQTGWDMTIKHGERGYYEVFKGIKGKRRAVMNFLNMVLSSPRPLELLLYSEEDIEWLVGDPQFFTNWGKALKQVLLSGHKVIIIHHVNRDPARIMAVIDQWVPLHLTGRLESYYYPKYTEKVIKATMFIARGTAAILAVTPEKGHDTDFTFFHTDPLVIRLAEENFLAFLSTCRQLVEIYKSGNMLEYYRKVCQLEEKPGFQYVLRNGPTSLTMPAGLYAKLLDDMPLPEKEKKERLALYQKRIEAFHRNLSLYRYREFINIGAFETNLMENGHAYNGLELFTDRAAKCGTADYIKHIAHIINLLEKYDHYEVILYKQHEIDHANKMYLSVKEEAAVILSTCHDPGNKPIAIITHQDNIANAFEEYFDNLLEHVAVSRRGKGAVIKKLRNSIDRLRASDAI